jgi:pyrimidine operon attenuation protein/uracil phosphoribosyltransferase
VRGNVSIGRVRSLVFRGRVLEPGHMASHDRISIMNERAVRRTLERMSREVVERHGGTEGLVLMGVHRRGVDLARLLRDEVERAESVSVPTGSLDITLYRDDLRTVGPRPVVGETKLPPGGIDDQAVVLVDDVLFTGRTVRAALNELSDWGRPARIYLCVLVDRGGRELPIQPDVVGRGVRVTRDQRVEVLVPELDGALGVEIVNLDRATP